MTSRRNRANLAVVEKKVCANLLLGFTLAGMLLPFGAIADPLRPGVQDQIKLGARAAGEIRKTEKVLPDDDWRTKEVRRIGERLVAKIPAEERKKRPFVYSFDVVDDKQVNAFALPGGPIFVYTGLLDRLTTEDQVAGLLAHEIIHIRNQHWASAYADNMKRRLGIAVVLSLLNASDTAFDVAGVADSVVFSLPYSRKHENEADTIGFDLMRAAGYNPQGLTETFNVLMEVGGSGGPEWVSTHPDTKKRVERIQTRVDEVPKGALPSQKPRVFPPGFEVLKGKPRDKNKPAASEPNKPKTKPTVEPQAA